jgi:ribokinase
MSIVVFGSINVDITVYGERLPGTGETLHCDRSAITLGGKGCNQAVAVARLGEKVNLIGRTGQDAFGDLARGELATFNVPDTFVKQDPDNETGIAVIGVDSHGENCISIVGGANMAIDETDVTDHVDIFTQADLMLMQLEIPVPAILKASAIVRASGGRVILDPAPAPVPGSGVDIKTLITAADIITPNEAETEVLVGIRPTTAVEAEQAANVLHDRGAACAIIKMGAAGVYFSSTEDRGFVPAFPVDAVDTVAAGDCFNGGLAYALTQEQDLASAVRFAAACGALSTTTAGASTSAPSLPDVQKLLV